MLETSTVTLINHSFLLSLYVLRFSNDLLMEMKEILQFFNVREADEANHLSYSPSLNS